MFNNVSMMDFPKFLKNLKKIFELKKKSLPTIIFAHKPRNEEIDRRFTASLEDLKFYTERAGIDDYHPDWNNRKILINTLRHDIDSD